MDWMDKVSVNMHMTGCDKTGLIIILVCIVAICAIFVIAR